MPNITTNVTYLNDIPLYKREKPYLVLLPAKVDSDLEHVKTDNLKFEVRRGIRITDIRGHEEEYQLLKNGFEIIQHSSELSDIEDEVDIRKYKMETEDLLRDKFHADKVVCWDVKMRKNNAPLTSTFNLMNPLEIEGPAVAAHVDTTYEDGWALIRRYLSSEDLDKFLEQGKRFQMINTWRTLVPVLEDNPLAVCDYRSVEKADLINCDRVFPHEAGEIYYLRYNPAQRWYWLSKMRSDELLLMKMYDTGAGEQAHFCPHVSVNNPDAAPNAPPRYSVESRSIVIS